MKAVVVNPESLVLLLKKKYSVHLKLESTVDVNTAVFATDLHVTHGDFGQYQDVSRSRKVLVSSKGVPQM